MKLPDTISEFIVNRCRLIYEGCKPEYELIFEYEGIIIETPHIAHWVDVIFSTREMFLEWENSPTGSFSENVL